MGILSNAGKDAGATAAATIQKTVADAIPAAEAAAKDVEDHATYSIAGIVADIANRLNGAELPVDLTIEARATVRISGKIGGLKISTPDYGVGQ
jgi:hypothetical protein